MRKLELNQWAAISEIVASVGVIVSIFFLAYSIRENTVVIQSTNDNFLYELEMARGRDISSSPSLATAYTKFARGEVLSDVEKTQLLYDNLHALSAWEIAFVRHRDGVYSEERWKAWNQSFQATLLDRFPKQSWEEVSQWYQDDFRSHVNAAYAEK